MNNRSGEMEILEKSQREKLKTKTLRDMKNAFGEFIGRLDMAEQRISEIGRATESSKNKENKNWRWGEGRSKPEDRKVI